MALDLSPVVSLAEYKQRVGRLDDDTTDDDAIGDLLTTVTRVVERRTGVAPGMLVPQTAQVFTFDAHGGTRLHLRDETGRQLFLRAITANSLNVDDDGDGDFEYLLDAADAWVRPGPVNAPTYDEPWTHVDLVPTAAGATITGWPRLTACVQITGDWGWETTPGALRERVVGIVREVLDAERIGGGGQSYDPEERITSVPSARALLFMLEQEYSRRLPVIV